MSFGESAADRGADERETCEAGVEIERKYLLRGMPDVADLGGERLEIEQGWIPGQRLRERLRRTRYPKGERYFRAIKFGEGIRRTEIEEETSREVFEVLWPLTAGKRVLKTRFRIREGGLLWEIDRFSDRELVLAEVELEHEEVQPRIPRWLEALVVREVTDEAEYVNFNLAR